MLLLRNVMTFWVLCFWLWLFFHSVGFQGLLSFYCSEISKWWSLVRGLFASYHWTLSKPLSSGKFFLYYLIYPPLYFFCPIFLVLLLVRCWTSSVTVYNCEGPEILPCFLGNKLAWNTFRDKELYYSWGHELHGCASLLASKTHENNAVANLGRCYVHSRFM